MSGFEALREEVRRRVDLVAIVSEHVELRRFGREFKGLCPFHQEKTPSFHVNPEKGFFHCHGCHVGGDLFKFVQLREKVGFPEAIRLLADRAGIDLTKYRLGGQEKSLRADLARVNEWAAQYFRQRFLHPNEGSAVRRYLEGRKISKEIADRFQVGLSLDESSALQRAALGAGFREDLLLAADLIRRSDRGGGFYDTFRHRLMFPIRDSTKRCLGFGGRTLGDSPAKYLNTGQTELFDKGATLFGLEAARDAIGKTKRAVLVEGYMDCLAAHQLGVAETVATLGTAATERHMEQLRRYCDEVILLFDSDRAGENAADRALALALQYGLKVRVSQVPGGKDPADFLSAGTASDFGQLLNSAVEALAFKWQRTLARYESSSGGRSRHEAISEFVSVVSAASHFGAIDSIQRGLIANQVAKLLALPSAEAMAMLRKSAEKLNRKGNAPGESELQERQESPAGADVTGEQGALRIIVEILLAEPQLVAIVSSVFEPRRIEDIRLRAIGETIWERYRASGDLPGDLLQELLAQTEDVRLSGILTALASAGEQCPNRVTVLHGLVDTLKRIEASRKRIELAESVKQLGQEGSADSSAAQGPLEARLAEISKSLMPEKGASAGGFAPATVPASWR